MEKINCPQLAVALGGEGIEPDHVENGIQRSDGFAGVSPEQLQRAAVMSPYFALAQLVKAVVPVEPGIFFPQVLRCSHNHTSINFQADNIHLRFMVQGLVKSDEAVVSKAEADIKNPQFLTVLPALLQFCRGNVFVQGFPALRPENDSALLFPDSRR